MKVKSSRSLLLRLTRASSMYRRVLAKSDPAPLRLRLNHGSSKSRANGCAFLTACFGADAAVVYLDGSWLRTKVIGLIGATKGTSTSPASNQIPADISPDIRRYRR